MVSTLISYGADVEVGLYSGIYTLEELTELNQNLRSPGAVDEITSFVEPQINNVSPLMVASIEGNTNVVSSLLTERANPFAPSPFNQQDAISLAINNRSFESAIMMLEATTLYRHNDLNQRYLNSLRNTQNDQDLMDLGYNEGLVLYTRTERNIAILERLLEGRNYSSIESDYTQDFNGETTTDSTLSETSQNQSSFSEDNASSEEEQGLMQDDNYEILNQEPIIYDPFGLINDDIISLSGIEEEEREYNLNEDFVAQDELEEIYQVDEFMQSARQIANINQEQLDLTDDDFRLFDIDESDPILRGGDINPAQPPIELSTPLPQLGRINEERTQQREAYSQEITPFNTVVYNLNDDFEAETSPSTYNVNRSLDSDFEEVCSHSSAVSSEHPDENQDPNSVVVINIYIVPTRMDYFSPSSMSSDNYVSSIETPGSIRSSVIDFDPYSPGL